MLQLGKFQIHCIVENRFHLDAGTMFGIVPKKIWSKYVQADEDNLIPMDTNVFLVQDREHNILIDSGLGDFMEDKQRQLYGCYEPSRLVSGLEEHGLKPADITIVLLSHLHWDHVGGTIKADDSGKPTVVFENATHYIHADEWEDANNPDERTSGVYFPERLKAIADAGLLKLVSGEEEIVPGIKVVTIGGHTRGQMGIEIEADGQKLIYYADAFPSCHHLRVPYVAAADLFPLDTQRLKRAIVPKAAEERWLIAMDHDLEHKVARIAYDGLKYRCEKVDI
jgi:glyoxylase-like metal-dependent hydrolase (beta-lactamase superfamily II)